MSSLVRTFCSIFAPPFWHGNRSLHILWIIKREQAAIINNRGSEIPVAGKGIQLLCFIPSSKVRRISYIPMLICSWWDQDTYESQFISLSFLRISHPARFYFQKYPKKYTKPPRSLKSIFFYSPGHSLVIPIIYLSFEFRLNANVRRSANIQRKPHLVLDDTPSKSCLWTHPILSQKSTL